MSQPSSTSPLPVFRVDYGLPADTGVNYFGQDPFPVDSALNARPLVIFTIGPEIDHTSDTDLVATVRNNVALVPNLAAIIITAHPTVRSEELKRYLAQELPLGIEVVKTRVVDPDRKVEASVTCYHNTYGNSALSSSFATPVDQLNVDEVKHRAVALPNLHHLIVSAPDRFVSQEQLSSCSNSLIEILESTNQLKTVVLPGDLFIRLQGILSALHTHRILDSVHITPATSINHSWLTPNYELILDDALTHGLENLGHIRELVIPVDLCKPFLLDTLPRLAGLQVLKIQPSSFIHSSQNAYLFRVVQRKISQIPGFGELRTLDVCATGTPIHSFLSAVFPNTIIL